MLQVLNQEEKKLFYKEVRLLNDLQHPNIVQLKGVSFQQLAANEREEKKVNSLVRADCNISTGEIFKIIVKRY